MAFHFSTRLLNLPAFSFADVEQWRICKQINWTRGRSSSIKNKSTAIKGIHPEPASKVVVQKPKTVGKRCLQSTLYRAYTRSLPDPNIVTLGEKLH
ncbi:hypothetical protein CHARACLAT_007956 [Characodon lateralis]|uniref:Uncharacterized protein n=1 Tax=Characodon lateralis TaxID=208331 RepID=A0ABU7EHE6_9TELE|nr:hypothetical protein [Characodon lateralis]